MFLNKSYRAGIYQIWFDWTFEDKNFTGYFLFLVVDFYLGVHDWVVTVSLLLQAYSRLLTFDRVFGAGYKFSVVINLRNLLKICSYFGCENKKYSGINNVI